MSLLPDGDNHCSRGDRELHVFSIKPHQNPHLMLPSQVSYVMGVCLHISLEKCLVHMVSEFPFKLASSYSFTRHFVHF